MKVHWWVLLVSLAFGAYAYYGLASFIECVTVKKDLPSVCLLDKVRTIHLTPPEAPQAEPEGK